MKDWTIGAELEIADSERDTPLGNRSTWDRKDYTIVNTNGVANDPLGITWKFGGEINTQPTKTVDDQLNVIQEVFRSLNPAPVANYRSNLHIHIHVPGLAGYVALVKRAIAYYARYSSEIFSLVDPLPAKPSSELALSRWRRRKRSHHTELTARVLSRIQAAETPRELRAAHAPLREDGQPMFHLVQRAGVNFLALWDHAPQTIEFRHFCLTTNIAEIGDAMKWCMLSLQAALTDQPPPSSLLWPGASFPTQPLINEKQELRYIATSPRYHSREAIKKTLEEWASRGEL